MDTVVDRMNWQAQGRERVSGVQSSSGDIQKSRTDEWDRQLQYKSSESESE